jgi:hypothetical protein
VAAPVFRAVIAEALRMLAVQPDAPLTIVEPDQPALEIREEV